MDIGLPLGSVNASIHERRDEFRKELNRPETLGAARGADVGGIARTAEEALEIAEVRRPVIVVMDIRLAGKRDGIDAALELFSKFGIRCVFVSAHQDKDARLRAEPARPLAWLPKPQLAPLRQRNLAASLPQLRCDEGEPKRLVDVGFAATGD